MTGDGVIDLKSAAASFLSGTSADPYRIANGYSPPDMKSFITGGEPAIKFAREVLSHASDQLKKKPSSVGPRGEKIVYNQNEVRLRAPVGRESRVIGAGGSFLSHTFNVSSWRKEKKISSLEEFAKRIRNGEIEQEPTIENNSE